jgi:hypothetical protein
MNPVFKGTFQHDDAFVDPALLVNWFKEKFGAQAFAAMQLALFSAATAKHACDISGFGAELFGFLNVRTRAQSLPYSSMSQEKKPNQTLEPTTTAVTDRAGARSAPAAVVAHL